MSHVLSTEYLNGLITAIAGSPLLWPFLWFPLLLILLPLGGWLRRRFNIAVRQEVVLAALGGAAAFMYLWLAWRYAFTVWYFDHGEPNVAQVAWYAWLGKPIYQSVTGPEFYNNLFYGPYLYLITALPLGLLGPSIPASKLVGVAAATAAIVLAWVVFKRQARASAATIAVGLVVLLFLLFRHLTFWARSESMLVLAAVAGLFAATSKSRFAPLLMGAAIGVSGDLKPQAVAHFIPILVLAMRDRFDRRALAVCGVTTVIVALLPFALPNVSIVSYFKLVLLATKGSLSPVAYFGVLTSLVTLCFPLCLLGVWSVFLSPAATRESFRAHRVLIAATILGAVLLLPAASRTGSGAWHLLPYIPVILFVALELHRTGGLVLTWPSSAPGTVVQALLWSWLLCVGVVALGNARDLHWQTEPARNERGEGVIDDIHIIQAAYGDRYTILMGAGGKYSTTWYRTELVFSGLPIGLDNCALMDFQGSGVGPPDLATFQAWLKSHVSPSKRTLWLVPREDVPFYLRSFRSLEFKPWANPELYPQSFKDDFAKMFPVRLMPTRYFDLYAEP